MSDLIKKIKIKKQDGTYTDYIPIGAEAKNVDCSDGESVEYKLNKKSYYYNTIADMKVDTSLKVGDMAVTLGYYEVNDGGGAEYRIVKGTYEDDGGSYHELNNNLFAELIIKGSLYPEQFGAYGDNIHDDSLAILNTFNKAKENNFSIIFTKTYYINSMITLEGLFNSQQSRVDFIQTNGYFKIDGQIILKNIAFSDITLKLQGGGDGTLDTYGVIFQKLRQCKLNLQANEVNKTAFYMNSEKQPVNLEIKFCNVTIRGYKNMRTLLHGSSNSSLGDGFGNYIDIVDGTMEYPIKFINCRDVNVLHYENFIDDTTYTKNSLELINAGVRFSLLCVGGKCKNLVYVEQGSIRTDYLLLISEENNTEQSTSEQLKVTGVYLKGAPKFSVDFISSTKCLYTVDAHEMTSQNNLVIGFTLIRSDTTPVGGGAYVPDISKNLILSYNAYLRANEISKTSEDFDLTHIHVDKIQNYVHVNGYITITSDIPYNSILMDLGDGNKSSYLSYGFIRQAADKITMVQIPENTSTLKNLSAISYSNGANLYIDVWYKTKKVN